MFFCTLPDCDYKVAVKLALGKRCICNRCDKPFILNEYSIRLVKPHCDECHKSRNDKPIISMTPQQVEMQSVTDKFQFPSLADRLSKVTKPVESDEEI